MKFSRLFWFSLSWLLLLFAWFVLRSWIIDKTLMLPIDLFICMGLLVSGIVIAVSAIVSIRLQPAVSGAALMIVLIGLTLYWTVGFQMGRRVWFEIRRNHYERLLAEATARGTVPLETGHTDDGPPRRFAFYWIRGIIDNWSGVVFDPSGDVMNVNNNPQAAERWLFGGEMYRCESLGSDWYLCWFT